MLSIFSTFFMKVCLDCHVKISKYNISSVTLMAESWTSISLDINSASMEESFLPLSNTQQSNSEQTQPEEIYFPVSHNLSPSKSWNYLTKVKKQAYLISEQVRDWKHLAASLYYLFVKSKTTFTLLCISTAMDLSMMNSHL